MIPLGVGLKKAASNCTYYIHTVDGMHIATKT